MTTLTALEDALALVLQDVQVLAEIESCALAQARGRVLAEDGQPCHVERHEQESRRDPDRLLCVVVRLPLAVVPDAPRVAEDDDDMRDFGSGLLTSCYVPSSGTAACFNFGATLQPSHNFRFQPTDGMHSNTPPLWKAAGTFLSP